MDAKYLLLASELEKLIPRLLSAGQTRLPAEEELCRRYNCSRQTVRAALKLMQERQLIIKRKGSGSFISSAASRGRIALILPRSGEYIFPAMLRTAKRFFTGMGLETDCLESENRILREREILTRLAENPPAGLIIYPAGGGSVCVNAEPLQRLVSLGVPVISLCAVNGLPAGVITAAPDTEAASRALALKLIASGKKGFRAILPLYSPAGTAQYAGLMQAAVQSGGVFDESDIIWLSEAEIRELQNGRYSRMLELLRSSITKDCSVFCGSDEIAYHTVKLLPRCKLSVPDDVAVSGFDNSYLCTRVSPAISSAGTENEEPMRSACSALLRLITGRSAENLLVPMQISERESTGKGR